MVLITCAPESRKHAPLANLARHVAVAEGVAPFRVTIRWPFFGGGERIEVGFTAVEAKVRRKSNFRAGILFYFLALL